MDEREADIAILECMEKNDELEQQILLDLAGKRYGIQGQGRGQPIENSPEARDVSGQVNGPQPGGRGLY